MEKTIITEDPELDVKPAKRTLAQRLRESNVSEEDEASSGRKRLRDIMGGETLVRQIKNNIWVIVLIALFTVAYVAIGYQCQQDAITISRLEGQVENAKLKALSSTSDLTRLSRQSSLENQLIENGNTELGTGPTPPYIISVPEK